MNMWPHLDHQIVPTQAARRPHAPLAFMHVPKSGGTSLIYALDRTAGEGPHIRGFDRFTFGSFNEFSTISKSTRRTIHLTSETLKSNAASIFGHFALSTLEQHYPDADIVTILREPTSRLLSHWTYWRGLRWHQLYLWGPVWSARLKLSLRPLAEFLSAPEIACQTDNIVTRMLLWPHKLIPDHDFIDPANDAAILAIARSRLQRFAFINIMENRQQMMNDFISWYGQPVPQLKINETGKLPRRRRTQLSQEICRDTMRRLEQRTRLDTVLWRDVANRKIPARETSLLQETARLQMIASCALRLA